MKKLIITIGLISAINLLSAQNYFRSGIFLHHSTGADIWGPNGSSTTTVPKQMHLYNVAHGFNVNDSINMNEEWWSPGDNEWSTQHEFFEGDTSFTNINYYLTNNKILVIKSCFPSSDIDAFGSPADTTNPTNKCIYNYKWHWRHIIKVMENHPDHFFAIWTNAPLEKSSTNITSAGLSKLFCRWAKDTLANGLDAIYGPFPKNVYVFDYFGKLTDDDGYEKDRYRTGEGDSHPNGLATDTIAPLFVKEIFDAALAYEDIYNEVFAPVGAQWYYNSMARGLAPDNSEYYLFISVKDTVIFTHSMKKIERTYYRYQGDSVILSPYFIYQTADTVSLFNPVDDKFYRLFVFNTKKGDTITLDIPYDMYHPGDSVYREVVDSITSVSYNNVSLKKYFLSGLDDFRWFSDFYLEKVGGYEWFTPLGGAIIPEADGPIRCYHDNGTDINFLGLACNYRIIEQNSIKNLIHEKVTIYPNPTSGNIRIIADFKVDKIEIFDYLGRMVLMSPKIDLDLSELSRGMYFVKIYTSDRFITRKIVKY